MPNPIPSVEDDTHRRRSIRLPQCDYTYRGGYFLTICTFAWKHLFGKITGGQMQLNEDGRIVVQEWENTSRLRTDTRLDVYVVMPNHFHAILLLEEGRGGTACRALESNTEDFGRPVSGSVPTIVRSFKSAVTRRINRRRGTSGFVVWQRNYYEHIIRDDDEFESIREYILLNPVRWESEKDRPETPYRKGEGGRGRVWAIK